MAITTNTPIIYDTWAIKSLVVTAPRVDGPYAVDIVYSLYRVLPNGTIDYFPGPDRALHIDDVNQIAATNIDIATALGIVINACGILGKLQGVIQ